MSEPLTLHAPAALLSPGRRVLVAAVLAIALAGAVAPTGRLIAALVLLLLAPGYLAERAVPGVRLPLLIRIPVWIGISLAMVALIYQWSWAMGLAVAAPVIWAGATALTLAALVAAWHDLGGTALQSLPGRVEQRLALAATAAIFALTLWTRFVQIESLALPPWVDSVHHTLMVRIAAETGRVPVSLEPYLPVTAMPYHWGYHVFIGTVVRLSGFNPADAVLLTGQILNALHTLTVAGFALALWRRPVAAPVAALVVGLLSLMPAYYLSWGRYTQLTGLLMLPGLAIAWQLWLARGRRGWWLVAAVTLAGLSLVHFRVLIFALALLAAMSLVWSVNQSWAELQRRLFPALAVGAGSAVLTAPWLGLLLAQAVLPNVGDGGLVGGGSYNALNEGLLWVGHTHWLVAFALPAALAGLWRRHSAAATMMLWLGLMTLAANPWLFTYLLAAAGLTLLLLGGVRRQLALILVGLACAILGFGRVAPPYLWLIVNDVLVITVFLPIAVLIGGGAALLFERLVARWPARKPLLVGIALISLTPVAIWGARDLRSVINEVTILAGPADRAAITWAAANTPPDARFLVNSDPWLPTARRGTDGGWWLLPLAGRWTTAPPVLYTYGSPEYVNRVNATQDTVIAYVPGSEQTIFDLIAAERITHVYLVAGKGPLQPTLFTDRPGFTRVYDQDGVVIFTVDRYHGNQPGQVTG